MERIFDIIQSFRPVNCPMLRIEGTESQPYAAVNPCELHVEVAAGASARLVVLHTSARETALHLVVGDTGKLELVELFAEAASVKLHVEQAAHSVCHMTTLLFAGAHADCRIDLNGVYAENNLNGLLLVSGKEHGTMKLSTYHRVEDCKSNSYIKGVAGGEALGEFFGLVYVAPDAQRTDAVQQSRNVLLSDAARIMTSPQLEIYADDVKCSHGATVGQMDSEAILYMRQRGLDEMQARRLQIEGFAGDIISRCGMEVLREALLESTCSKIETM